MNWTYEEGRIYSTDETGELLAETTFTRGDNKEVNINHTYVASVLRGHGTAGEMMTAVAGFLRENGLKATASCSYAKDWFKRNSQQYSDIISEEMSDEAPSCTINGRH